MVALPYYSTSRAAQSTPVLPGTLCHKSPEETVAQAKEVMRDMARDMKGNWIGPCPLQHFFESMHAPLEDDTSVFRPNVPATYFQDSQISCEKDLYRSLTALMNGEAGYSSPLPDHSLVSASDQSEGVSEEGAQICPGMRHYERGIVSKGSPTTLDLVLLAIEGKDAESKDIVDDTVECTGPLPHNDCQAPYENSYKTSTLIRGQLANYATQISRRQHRTHFYMVYLFHPFVRFIRWDRAGAIVTERVDYVQDCTTLMRFLYLFGRLDRAGKGFDPTVRHATSIEAVIAKKHLQRWAPKTERTVFKMDVPSGHGSKPRQFLVWGALADPESPIGRATRGYPAVEVVDGVVSAKPVFLKEQWRDVMGKSEMETLKELNKKGVHYIPTLVCGGDLPGQETMTHEISDASWRVGHKRIHKRAHTRFVVAEVGRPLQQFPSSKVMLGAIYNAFQGHKQAYEECNILHRDISGGNILILDNNEGLLNDWDLAQKGLETEDGASVHDRTGTWPFMSAGLLLRPKKRHTARDDLESFFWVALFYGLHFLSHTRRDTVEKLMTLIFEQCDFVESDGIPRGGDGKVLLVGRRRYLGSRRSKKFSFTRSQPLTNFIFDGLDLLKEWEAHFDPSTAEDSEGEEEEDYVPVTHADMEKIWIQALQSPLWPEADHSIDQVRLAKTFDLVVRRSQPNGANLKRSKPQDEDEDGSSRRKRRKTCHGSEAARL